MEDKNSHIIQLEDIVELKCHELTVKEIETIANNERVRRHYENQYNDCLYSTILLSLTHKSYPENEAELLWDAIVAHMGQLNHILGRNAGVAVAALDYLSNIKNELSKPKIIEENKSNFVIETTTVDTLTRLHSRQVFDIVLQRGIEEAIRNTTILCLLMIDIDDFKNVNDTYGHLKGDEVLKKIGATINDSVRGMDLAARYGGEEIAVVMPSVDIEQAHEAAERIRRNIEKIQFNDFSVTVSIGVSQTSQIVNNSDRLINAADTAMYKAKDRGKNQVTCYPADQ